MSKHELTPPYVKLTRHPLKWTWNQLKTYGTSIILMHAGTLAIVALYYLLFEVNPSMTHWWHHAVSNDNLRHNIRNVAEGLLGGLLVMAALYRKPKKVRKPHFIDKVEHALGIPNFKFDGPVRWWEVVLMPIFVLVYASVGFAAGYGALHFAHIHATQSVHGNFWEALWANGWDAKIVGLIASYFFGKRPAKGVMNHLQLFVVTRHWSKGNDTPAWWWTPAYQERFNKIKASSTKSWVTGNLHSTASVYAIVFGGVILLGLDGFGYYILKYIAKA